MKLIYCPQCNDVVRLLPKHRSCCCGMSWGRYVDGIKARIGGDAIPIGFSNGSLSMALMFRPEEGDGSEFTAFVIPKKCRTVEVEKDV